MVKYSVWLQKFFREGRPGGTWPPNVGLNLGPPDIWKLLDLGS